MPPVVWSGDIPGVPTERTGIEKALKALDSVINGFDHTANQELQTAYFYLMVARNKLEILRDDPAYEFDSDSR